MNIFNNKGLMIIPSPQDPKAEKVAVSVVIKKCFCINGHNLVCRQAQFGSDEGIVLDVTAGEKQGIIALSPVFGDKSRITLGLILDNGELVQLMCPVCKAKLPVYSNCECGGDLVVMFTGELNNYNDCVGVCNRVGCKHAEIKKEGNLLSLTAPGMF